MNDQARDAVLGWQQAINAAWEQRQAGLLASAPTQEQPSITRGLTQREMDIARSVFGDSLDTSQIQLSEGGFLSIGGYTRALPNHVHFPDGTLTNPPDNFDHLLVHELTHIWQYQRGHTVQDLLPPAIAGARAYDYGGEQGLQNALVQGKTFTQFNTEQQADILADYYIRTKNGDDTSAYDPYVRSVRSIGNVIPDWPPGAYPDYPTLPR